MNTHRVLGSGNPKALKPCDRACSFDAALRGIMAAGMLSGSAHSPPRQSMISTSAPASAEMSAPDAFAACARLHGTEQKSGTAIDLLLLWCHHYQHAYATAAQARLHETMQI